MRTLELPDMLRKYGVEPVLVAGWQTRGNEYPSRPVGALRHWTAGGAGRTPSLGIVTNGRSDLPGPLCAVLQSREAPGTPDKAYVVASGKANHGGTGTWNGISGNYKLLGLEIEWSGPGEAFSPERKDISERIMAALLDCTSGSNDNVAEHREYATPAGRKIDTNLDGNELRRRMAELRIGTPAPAPAPAPAPQPAPPPPSSTLEYAMDTINLRNAQNTIVTGKHVDNLQGLLIATWAAIPAIHPYIPKMVNGYGLPDGKAGAGTKEALKVFQRHVGLLDDAVCGNKTWKRLIEF